MPFLNEGDRDRRPGEGTQYRNCTDNEPRGALPLSETDSIPLSDGSLTPRFGSGHVPLNFGSMHSTFQAPPFVSGSGPASAITASSNSSSSSTSTVCSPKATADSTTRSMADLTTPSSATTVETPIAASTFSATCTRSPSVSSVSSIRSRSPFATLPPLKIPPSTAPPPIPLSYTPSTAPASVHTFDPVLPTNVFAISRRAFYVHRSTQTDPLVPDAVPPSAIAPASTSASAAPNLDPTTNTNHPDSAEARESYAALVQYATSAMAECSRLKHVMKLLHEQRVRLLRDIEEQGYEVGDGEWKLLDRCREFLPETTYGTQDTNPMEYQNEAHS